MARVKRIFNDILFFWRPIALIFTPLIFLAFPLAVPEKEIYCGYVVLVMAVYWMTEVIPLAVTALLPLVLYPLFGVVKAKDVATTYLNDSNFVFFGSMIMALAVEESQLHKRIALKILMIMGPNPRLMMLGFQISTALLSMWMSNTATTAMMVPVALAVIKELSMFHSQRDIELKTIDTEETPDSNKQAAGDESIHLNKVPKTDLKMYKGLLLAIAYSANIGGTGTLTGTGSNIVFSGDLEKFYEKQDTITFASWMAFSIPAMLLCLLLSWLWLQVVFIGIRRNKTPRFSVRNVVRQKYKELGAMSFAEMVTFVLFIMLVLLWIFRDPKVFPGWGSVFPDGYVTDGTTAMFIGCILFAIPKERPDCYCFPWRKKSQAPKRSEPLINWKSMQRKFAWDVILLVGGGYAMAAGVKESQLSEWIGSKLSSFTDLPDYAFVVIGVVCVTFITEFSSNVATATIFVPILNSVAKNLWLNPLYLILPVTVGCSFAFMLPVATPPNAIVFSAGFIRVYEMALTGFVMNWICIGVTLLNINTYATWLFKLDQVPLWAEQEWNKTANFTVNIVL